MRIRSPLAAWLRPLVLLVALSPVVPAMAASCPPLLDKSFDSLDTGKSVNLCRYAGKVLLVVNTASHCGFSPQEKGLQHLQAEYGPQGFVVLGFPSNDFFQELSNPQSIVSYSKANYGVQFELFAPSHVRGSEVNPLFAELIRESGTTPKWNFYKYLIGRDGKVVAAYSSLTTPEDKDLKAQIRKLLAQHP